MEITLLDATDFFNRGGFLDTQTGAYIPPEGYLPIQKKSFPGTPPPAYSIIRKNPERFLEAPVINQMAVDWHIALELGITSETLHSLGFSEENCRNRYFSMRDSRELRANGYTDEHWKVLHSFIDYAGTKGLAATVIEAKARYRHQLMSDWLQTHGFSIAK